MDQSSYAGSCKNGMKGKCHSIGKTTISQKKNGCQKKIEGNVLGSKPTNSQSHPGEI
jgi:hypothetical protein